MSRGWGTRGATPSRINVRRSGPMRSSRYMPNPRTLWAGRKSLSRVRLSRSTTSVRLAAPPRRDRQLADGGGIAQAEIEALRADRRHDMAGFADQGDAAVREAARSLDRERKGATAGLDPDLAEDRMRAQFDLLVERGRVESAEPLGLLGRDDAHQARPQARQRHQRERPVFGMELGRDVVVRPRMRDIEGQRGLRIAVLCGVDPGGSA